MRRSPGRVRRLASRRPYTPSSIARPRPICGVPIPLKRPPPPTRTEALAAEAEILVGTTMWLARVRDWLAEEIDLAPMAATAQPATITLRRADLEAFRNGLGQAVSLLDRLTVDPAHLPQPTEPDVTPAATSTGRTLQ